MGYTVARPGGCTDWEFQGYLAGIQGQMISLDRVPRVWDPISDQRWLMYWDDKGAAEWQVAALRRRDRRSTWRVVEVPGPPSIGPIVPLWVNLLNDGYRIDAWLHDIGHDVLTALHPEAVATCSGISIEEVQWQRYKAARGGLEAWGREVMPLLTGLRPEQLEAVGYQLIDVTSHETLVNIRPASPPLASVS